MDRDLQTMKSIQNGLEGMKPMVNNPLPLMTALLWTFPEIPMSQQIIAPDEFDTIEDWYWAL